MRHEKGQDQSNPNQFHVFSNVDDMNHKTADLYRW